MAHACSCHAHATERSPEPITPEMTVKDIAHHYAGSLELMKELGINHCCGAHLTLREAAASAGVTLEALLEALTRPAAKTS